PPVFDAQAGDASEFALVVRHQNQVARQRVRRDPEIVRADQAALGRQGRTNASVNLPRLFWQRLDRDDPDQPLEIGHAALTLDALLCTESKLAIGDDRHCGLAGLELCGTGAYLRRPVLTEIDADIAVDEIARGHYRPSRSCGGRVSLMSSNMSSGIEAMMSNASARLRFFFSRSTIS